MNRNQWLPALLPAGMLLALLFCFPKEMAQGVRDGLSVCGAALVPSLFPFFVLCTFLTRSGLSDVFGQKAEKITRLLFRLPGEAGSAVLLGLCGGYPVGMRMTAQLYEKGALTKAQAERMSLFCVAAGPAFVTGTVGASMLGNRALGYLLLASVTLSSLTVGVLLRFTDTPSALRAVLPRRDAGVARCICEAVADAGETMLSVCAWVLLFSGVCAVIRKLPAALSLPLGCLLEVTSGCRTAASASLPLPLIAAILGFGGLAVQCQLLPYVSACGVRLSRFFAFRAVHAALSAVFCEALLCLFPQVQSVVLLRNGSVLQPMSASAPASAALLVTAAVFIWQTAPVKQEKS